MLCSLFYDAYEESEQNAERVEKEANNNDGGKEVGSCLGREERKWRAEVCAVSVLSCDR